MPDDTKRYPENVIRDPENNIRGLCDVSEIITEEDKQEAISQSKTELSSTRSDIAVFRDGIANNRKISNDECDCEIGNESDESTLRYLIQRREELEINLITIEHCTPKNQLPHKPDWSETEEDFDSENSNHKHSDSGDKGSNGKEFEEKSSNVKDSGNTTSNDSPRPWDLFFQDSESPQVEELVELHNFIMYYLTGILLTVSWVMFSILIIFSYSKFNHKYTNHGTLIELIWTISPALTLVLIAFPSLKLILTDSCINIFITNVIHYLRFRSR